MLSLVLFFVALGRAIALQALGDFTDTLLTLKGLGPLAPMAVAIVGAFHFATRNRRCARFLDTAGAEILLIHENGSPDARFDALVEAIAPRVPST